MTVEQIYTLLNQAAAETFGSQAVATEDLSDLHMLGDLLVDTTAVDNYVKSLIDKVGRVYFVDRVYKGRGVSLVVDAMTYGAIAQKIDVDELDAAENPAWSLTATVSVDQDTYTPPTVRAKYFQESDTFEIPISFPIDQVNSAFTSRAAVEEFFAAIENRINMSMTIHLDNLIMRTVNYGVAATLYNAFPGGTYTGAGNTRAINLLKRYNDSLPVGSTPLTVAECLTDAAFLRFAAEQIRLTVNRLKEPSKLFNVDGRLRFTPPEMLHVLTLAEFDSATSVYLQSDTYHNDLVALPNSEIVGYWQGSGTDYGFGSTSKIDVTVTIPGSPSATKATVTTSGILCVMFDRDAAVVLEPQRKVAAHRNEHGEFVNYWYKAKSNHLVDTAENMIVFFVAA